MCVSVRMTLNTVLQTSGQKLNVNIQTIYFHPVKKSKSKKFFLGGGFPFINVCDFEY